MRAEVFQVVTGEAHNEAEKSNSHSRKQVQILPRSVEFAGRNTEP